MTPDQNHYEVLGVSEDASESEIENAFYRKVREHPPEQDQEGHERIREAYEVLSNPVSRREYDNMAAHGEEIEQLKDEAEQILNQENPDIGKAIKNLKKAVVLGPEIGLLRNHLGQAYLQNGNPEDALQQFEKAIELDETNAGYRLSRGHALERLDRLGEAERAVRSVWEEDEGDYAAARALAGVLFNQDKAEEAHEVLDTAIWADDKLDFEDFFCYYDKLQLYVAQGKTEILEDELETVKDLPETEEDRKYAAFMLSQTGQTLMEAHVYRLAEEFVDAAVELDPGNPRLQAAQDFVQENAQIEQSFEEIAESSSVHEFVKHIVAVFYQRYLGVIDEQEFQERTDEIDDGLRNVMGVDPENTRIKESVRRIRDNYPEVFQLYEYGLEAILSMPEATERVDDCPHCGEPIRFEKGEIGTGACANCNSSIEISGSEIEIPEDGEDPTEEDELGPLAAPCVNGLADTVKALLKSGRDPNQPINDEGITPLHLAASNGHPQVVEILLDAGADPKKTDETGVSPLHWAALADEDSGQVTKMLLDAGAKPNRRDLKGCTALHQAVYSSNREAAKVLLEAGANPEQENQILETPLDAAERENDQAMVRLLRQYSSVCFVATVAYDDSDHPDVVRLRTFRDEILRTWAFGRWFIYMYYHLGPTAVEFLEDQPRLKRWVRYVLKSFLDRLP